MIKFEKIKSFKDQEIKSLIFQRREAERMAIKKGNLSFEALRSNFGQLLEKPEIYLQNPRDINQDTVISGREDDNIVSHGLISELEKHKLQPDKKTFYLIDCGAPHLPELATVLLNYQIDPAIYMDPSDDEIQIRAGHYRRYIATYEEHKEELFRKREQLQNPMGYALLINSHAEENERARIAKNFPSLEKLKSMGIIRIVLGKEAFYYDDNPNPNNPNDKEFFEASEINKYVKKLGEAGMRVVVIGFDYRYENENEELESELED